MACCVLVMFELIGAVKWNLSPAPSIQFADLFVGRGCIDEVIAKAIRSEDPGRGSRIDHRGASEIRQDVRRWSLRGRKTSCPALEACGAVLDAVAQARAAFTA